MYFHQYLFNVFAGTFRTGVKNPILVADSLLRTQMRGEMSLGRIPPRWDAVDTHLIHW